MKRTRIIILILSLLLIIIGCTSDDATSTASLTTTKDNVTTTTVDNNSTTSTNAEITTTKENSPTTTITYNEPTTTKGVVITTKEDITTTTQENITAEHIHEYGEWHTKNSPTCTGSGKEERICSCGESETRTIEALGHNYSNWVTVIEPTDNRNGKRERKCLRCSHKEEEIIDSLSYIDSLFFVLSDDKTYYKVDLDRSYPYDTMIIPTTYLGKPVKEINRGAIYIGSPVVNIYLPNSITNLNSADNFKDYSKTYNIDVPSLEMWERINIGGLDNVKYNLYIDGNLFTELTLSKTSNYLDTIIFRNCVSLETIIFEEGVEKIEDQIFEGCSSLKFLTIPSSVKMIGNHSFAGCKDVNLSIQDLENWLNISYYNGSDTLSSNFETYMTYNLYLNNEIITNLTIPNTNRGNQVSANALRGCISLKTIEFSEEIKIIRDNAFRGCSSLTSVNFSNSISAIYDNAFNCCSSITSITLPNTISVIGEGAFGGCSSLSSITLPFIGKSSYPFGYIFGRKSYDGCISTIQKYYLTSSIYGTHDDVPGLNTRLYYIPESLKDVTVTNCAKIQFGSFSNCANIISITITEKVKTIEDCAFEGCSSLSSIFYTGSEAQLEKAYIGKNNLDASSMLTFYVDAKPLTKVSTNKYRYYLSDTNKAYYLETVNKNITSCDLERELDGITVVSLASNAFSNCQYLESITIPSTLKSIGKDAFNPCPSLKKINISSIESWCNINFYNYTENVLNHYNSNPLYYAHNLYLNDELVTDLVIPDGVTSISNYAFYNCLSLTSIVIPRSVTSIGSSVFGDVQQDSFKIYYAGSSSEWDTINNASQITQTKYFYSETEPEKSGNYWHYVDGVITEW